MAVGPDGSRSERGTQPVDQPPGDRAQCGHYSIFRSIAIAIPGRTSAQAAPLAAARQAEALEGDGVELDLHGAAADVVEQAAPIELRAEAVEGGFVALDQAV
jgi:hypothetical protein